VIINPLAETQVPALTEEQAVAAYTALVTGLSRNYGYDGEGGEPLVAHPIVAQTAAGGDWPDGPVLCRNYEGWTSTTDWAVIWEGGPYDWSMYLDGGIEEEFGARLQAIELPDGVWAEPINGFAVGLYVHEGPATVPGLAEPLR
jgi:hypothetical protein